MWGVCGSRNSGALWVGAIGGEECVWGVCVCLDPGTVGIVGRGTITYSLECGIAWRMVCPCTTWLSVGTCSSVQPYVQGLL